MCMLTLVNLIRFVSVRASHQPSLRRRWLQWPSSDMAMKVHKQHTLAETL